MSFALLNVTPLSSRLFNSDDKENLGSCVQFGGIFCETKYFWLVRDSCLTVGCTKTGLIIGNWKFSTISKTSVKINCVTELPRENVNIPFLIIGLKCNGERGMICIFQFTCSKVLRAVELPNEVKRISIISTIGNKCLLPEVLALLDGVIAVGTSYGGLLLLDICLQEYENASSMHGVLKDEKNACQIMDLQLDDISLLESHKNLANLNVEHLAIYLNDLGNCSKQIFTLKGPEGAVLGHLSNQNVLVTALYYCSQLCSLFVGYNFGVWQIWNLKEMNVVYTSPILDKNTPITHFAVQEPCDDPRAFCYIWVIYNNVEPFSLGFPLAVMYALLFDTKIWNDKYGFFYQGLFSCQVRFHRELVLIENNDEKPLGGCCTDLYSVSKSVSNLNSTKEFTEDGFSYCFFIWNTWTIDRKLNTYLTLFDLNQWYKEQMPSCLHKRNKHVDSYTITVSISDFLKSVNNEDDSALFDVKVDFKSLVQFKGAMKLEEHYYPSSLCFNLFTLKEKEVILIKNRGCQQNLLYQIVTQGPTCLTNPSEFYHESIRIGLTPLFVEHEKCETSVNFQKEFLLNIALEQQLFCWLCKCAVISSHSFNSFLQWAWNRAQVLKQNAYDLCNYLFDSTGMSLDSNACNTFSNCLKQLKVLKDLHDYILKKLNFLPSLETIKEQLNNLETTISYLEIIKWSINIGLLPETPTISNPSHDRLNRQFVPYPINDISTFLENRRKLLNDVNNSDYSNLLFIDNLINSGKKNNIFKRNIKINATVKYPFPCLRSLFEIYLEDSISLITKHLIFIYTLLDIMEYLDEDGYEMRKKNLQMFSVVFKIPTTVTKVVEAFWQLDHGNYYDAVNKLLDPHIHVNDIEIMYHNILLQTLILHDQCKLALLYLQIKKPPLLLENDLCLVISLYIANNMLDEAYHFQKSGIIEYGDTKLFRHFFEECINKNKIVSLLGMSLTVSEEEIFVKYLNKIQNSQLKNLKTLYRLQKYNCRHDMEKEKVTCFPSRRKETMNAETSRICLPVTVYPQIFDGKNQSLNIDTNSKSRCLMKTRKNNPKRNLNTEQKRLNFSPYTLKKNTNELLDNLAQGASEKYSPTLDNFGDSNLSIQISTTKTQFELDVNASELRNVTSELEITGKYFISNEKGVLRKISDNMSSLNNNIESSISAPKVISLNQRDENYDNLEILHPVCLTKNEYVPNEKETSNHRSHYLDKMLNLKPNDQIIERPELEVQIISENAKENSEILDSEILYNINTFQENKENLEPSTSRGFSCSKPVNNELISSKNNIHLEHNTKCVEEKEMSYIQNKITIEKLKLNSLTENNCTSKYHNKKVTLWNSLPTEQSQKHTRTSSHKKNNRKTPSLIRVKISPKKGHQKNKKNKIIMEEEGVTFKTNKNYVYQKEHTSYNKNLENNLEQNFINDGIYETGPLFRTNCSNSSFIKNVERFSTRFRLTPKRGKIKSKNSAVSLIRLRTTPIKEITKNGILGNTKLSTEINISFPELIQSGNEKLTISACSENKIEIKSKPNSPLLERSINTSTNMLVTEENEKINLSKDLSRIEFVDKNCIELFTDINDDYKQSFEINFEKPQRRTNETSACNVIQCNIKSPNKIEEHHNNLLYVSTYEQENPNSLNEIQEHSRECLNEGTESEEVITIKHKGEENMKSSASVDKSESIFKEKNVAISSENHSPNYNKTETFTSKPYCITTDSQINISEQSSNTHPFTDLNNISSNICENYLKSLFQNEGLLNYDQEHKSVRKQLPDFENENFQNNLCQVSFLEEVSLNSVSRENHDMLNKAIIYDDVQIRTFISSKINISNKKEKNGNITVKHNEDISEDDSNDAKQNPDTSLSSVQYMPNFDKIEVIEISDTKRETKEKSILTASSSTFKSDFLNNAFINDDTNFTAVKNLENKEENNCIKFIYGWVADKGVNTSFPYQSGESSEEECELKISDNKIEMFTKFKQETMVNIEQHSQNVNTSRRKTSSLQNGIPSSKDIAYAHGSKIT